jgi:ABC-type multidrug transport system, ATPase and permease components
MVLSYEEKNRKSTDYSRLFRTGEKAPILKETFRANKGRIALSFVLYVIKDSPVYIIPVCTANLIDLVQTMLTNTLTFADEWLPLLINSLLIVVSLIQNILTHTLYARLTDNMLRNASASLRESVVRKLQHLSLSFSHEMNSGDLQAKFLRDVQGTEDYLTTLFKTFIPLIITSTITYGIVIYKSWIVAIFFLLAVPLDVLLVHLFSNKIKEESREYRLANDSLSRGFTTMIEMTPVVKAHGLEDIEIESMTKKVEVVRSKGLNLDSSIAVFGSSIFVIGGLLNFACLGFCIYLAVNGQIGIGEIVLFESLFSGMNGRIQSMLNLIPSLATGKEAIASLSELMNKEEIQDDADKLHLPSIEGTIAFDDVFFRYPDSDKEAIEHLSFAAKPGECVAFVGPSGSGKTTIVNLLLGLLKPQSGTITIDGHSLNELSLKDYRHHISLVSQSPVLFNGTVKENITYGLKQYSDEDVMNALHEANCDDFIQALPKGVDTMLDENGSNLSGGQKQRLTIARALIRKPDLLFFDEATSALDNIAEKKVQSAIDASMKGRTTFVIAHRISTIRNADKILYIEDGKILESGTYDELMAAKGKFYAMESANEKAASQAA